MKINNLLLIIVSVLSIGVGICSYGVYDNFKMNDNSQEEIINYSQCNNLSLENTTECLRDYISTFYNYTIRTDEIRTIEDIKLNGGDCYDYNKLYERLGNEFGFDTFSFRIYVGELPHRITIISDETGYCLLDQLYEINCFEAKNVI